MHTRTLTIVLIVLVVLGVGFFFINRSAQPVQPGTATTTPMTLADIRSFEDCRAAGYPVTGTAPRQCRLPDGRLYAEEVPVQPTYSNATSDQIRITAPAPGSVTGKSFTVSGEARGNWYFEASFPVQVLDKDGKQLATAVAQAQGDWMTTSFVPFSLTISVPESYIGPATLLLKKDNPSGLPQNDASLAVPITIEY